MLRSRRDGNHRIGSSRSRKPARWPKLSATMTRGSSGDRVVGIPLQQLGTAVLFLGEAQVGGGQPDVDRVQGGASGTWPLCAKR